MNFLKKKTNFYKDILSTKTKEELDELFDKTVNRLNILEKLIDTVSDITEKKRINNVITSIKFVLDYVALNKYNSYSDIDSDSDSYSGSDSYSDNDSKQNFLILNLVIQKGKWIKNINAKPNA